MSTSDKLLAVFGLFTLEEPEWSVEDAAERLGLAMSTTYRFFKSLGDAGLISAVSPGRYMLGPAIVALDRQARLLDPLIRVARPVMQRLAADVAVPGVVLLCRLFRKQVMCIHQEFVQRPPSTVSYERGRPMPLYRGAASKVILANLPPRTARTFFEANHAAMVAAGFAPGWEAVKAVLRELRSGRVCVTAGELDPGMTGIGAALRNPAGTVDASLGFVLPDELSSPERVAVISTALERGACEIETALAAQVAPTGPIGSRAGNDVLDGRPRAVGPRRVARRS